MPPESKIRSLSDQIPRLREGEFEHSPAAAGSSGYVGPFPPPHR